MKWERIDGDNERAKVWGGWIVKTSTDVWHITPEGDYYGSTGYDWRVATCFVPDANHSWLLEPQ